jgi:membrane associated rhomboid family serine protease
MILTFLIIASTVLFSMAAFRQPQLMYKYNFNAFQIVHRKQWYRLFTPVFLHANWEHLIFNMLSLFFFAPVVESQLGSIMFLIIYAGAAIASSIPDLIKHKNDYAYNALGASGAVSAIIFTSILLNPTSKIMLMLIPIPIPAVLFGLLYLAYSAYMSKRNLDNIGHNAHFWGAIFGFVFPILLYPQLLQSFFHQLLY